MKLLVINGPNINMLGIRETQIYGASTYNDLYNNISEYCLDKKIDVTIVQSNSEGEIVTIIQEAYNIYNGIIINAGAYTHTSIAILDALKSVNLPAVEVHLTDITKREEFRKTSYLSYYCFKTIMGKGIVGYLDAVDALLEVNDDSSC